MILSAFLLKFNIVLSKNNKNILKFEYAGVIVKKTNQTIERECKYGTGEN